MKARAEEAKRAAAPRPVAKPKPVAPLRPITSSPRPAPTPTAGDLRGGLRPKPDPGTAPKLPEADTDRELRERNVYQSVLALFRQYGLAELADLILQYAREGYDGNTISLLLQETEPYKRRFAGNERRRQEGLAVLSPAEYLALERSYEQIMRSYGLPPGFYDQQSDFHEFIGLDISPAEIAERVRQATTLVNDANPEVRAALAQWYPELSSGDLIANFLDPKKALPLIDKKVKAAEFGGAAKRHGLDVGDRARAEQYASLGIDKEKANAGFSEISGFLDDTSKIARRFRSKYGQAEAEQEIFGGLASARRKRERLYDSEEALFSGRGGFDSDSLRRATTGSY